MNDPALPRRHRIKSKCLARLTHPLCRHARGEFQFRKPRGAIIAAIKSHAIVQPRIEPQPAMPDVLKRQQQFPISLQQQILIRTSERDHNVRIMSAWLRALRYRNVALDLEPHFLDHQIEEPV